MKQLKSEIRQSTLFHLRRVDPINVLHVVHALLWRFNWSGHLLKLQLATVVLWSPGSLLCGHWPNERNVATYTQMDAQFRIDPFVSCFPTHSYLLVTITRCVVEVMCQGEIIDNSTNSGYACTRLFAWIVYLKCNLWNVQSILKEINPEFEYIIFKIYLWKQVQHWKSKGESCPLPFRCSRKINIKSCLHLDLYWSWATTPKKT